MGWMSAEAWLAARDLRNERTSDRLAKLARLMEQAPGGMQGRAHDSALSGFVVRNEEKEGKRGAEYRGPVRSEGRDEVRSMRAAERLRLPSKVYRHAPATLPDDIILKAERLGVDLAKYAAEA